MYRGNGLNDFGDEFSQFKGVMAPVDAAAEEAALREVWPSAAPKASPAKRALDAPVAPAAKKVAAEPAPVEAPSPFVVNTSNAFAALMSPGTPAMSAEQVAAMEAAAEAERVAAEEAAAAEAAAAEKAAKAAAAAEAKAAKAAAAKAEREAKATAKAEAAAAAKAEKEAAAVAKAAAAVLAKEEKAKAAAKAKAEKEAAKKPKALAPVEDANTKPATPVARRTRGGKGADKEEEKPWHEALGDAIAASPIGKMFGMGKKASRTSVVEKVAEPEPAAAAPVRRSSRLRN